MADSKAKSSYRPRVAAVTGWTILFFVLLRVAIGWHFLYEGVWKVKSGTFSATPYLLASVGPLKDVFRSMVNDADGFKRIGIERDADGNVIAVKSDFQRAEIERRVKMIEDKYKLDAGQKAALDDLVKRKTKELDEMYGVKPITVAMPTYELDRENEIRAANGLKPSTRPASADAGTAGANVALPDQSLLAQAAGYVALLKQVAAEEKSHDPKYLLQRMEFNTTKISGARNALLARVEAPAKAIAPLDGNQVDQRSKMTPEDLKFIRNRDGGLELTAAQFAKGPLPLPQETHFPGSQLVKLGMKYKTTTRTEWQDLGMMFGLCGIGACLVLGLFTRFAAFCATIFLAMFYFSMPPWPGLPEVGPLEGHYLIVNKNLIEMIACLMIMTSRVGRWMGLDAFLGAMKDRRRRKRAEAVVVSAQAPSDRVFLPGEARPAVRDPARA